MKILKQISWAYLILYVYPAIMRLKTGPAVGCSSLNWLFLVEDRELKTCSNFDR